ncbi:MAG: sensor histidine kinase [Candidatus Schekmanbacteria bacterium]|nr:MAG: sensor histidine kinase [Candidatus Schekmanbacteria bacterium]
MSQKDNLENKLIDIHHTFLLGKMTGDLFHEVNNIIGASIGFAQLAKMSMSPDDVNKLIDVVLNSTEKIKEVSKSAQTYLSAVSKNGELTDISDVLNNCAILSRKSLIKKGIKLSPINKKLIAFQTDVRILKHTILSFISAIIESNANRGGTLELNAEKTDEMQVKIEINHDYIDAEHLNNLSKKIDSIDISDNFDNDAFMAVYLSKKYLGATLEIVPRKITLILDEVITQ